MYKPNITVLKRKDNNKVDVFIYYTNIQGLKILIYYGKDTKPVETLQGQTVTSFCCDADLQDEFIISLVDKSGKVINVDTFYLINYLKRK